MRLGPTTKQSLRIAAIYAAFGAAWILFSDQLAAALAPDPATLTHISMLKGWLFIAVTALLLNHLVRRQLEAVAEENRARLAADVARGRAEQQHAQASAAAETAAHRLAVATQAAHLGTWDWEITTGRLVCDERMHALYGLPAGADRDGFDTWFDVIHPGDRQRLRELIDAALAGRQDFHTQFRLLLRGGTTRHIEGHAAVLRDTAHRPTRMIGVNWDITERVAAEQRYRYLADHAGDVLWIIDLATRCYTYVSPSIRRLRGCEPEALVGKPFAYGLTPASVERLNQLLPVRMRAFLAGEPEAITQSHEVEHFRPDGSTARTEIVTTFIHNDRGGIDVVGITRDISRRHAAEQALKESTRRLAHAEAIAGIGHWSLKLHTDIIEASPQAATLYGLPHSPGWSRAEIEHIALPEYRGVLDESLRALVHEGRHYDVTYRIRRLSDGAVATIHSRAEFDAKAGVVFGTIQDITEREQVVAALRSSEAKLRLLVSNAPVVLFQIGADGVFRMSEGGGLAHLGLRPGEVVGHPVTEVYRDFPQICAQVRAALAGAVVHEMIQVGNNWFEAFYTPMRDAAGTVTDVIGLAIDVTERKLTEARLRLESAALGAAAHAIVITDAQGTIESINPAFTNLTGYTADESIGRNLGRLVQSGQQGEGFYQRLWSTILAGNTWHGEIVNRHKDGTLVPEEQTITPVHDEAGHIAHFIAIKLDISERRRLQEQALRSQRLDSVGRLAGGIAHDLNNILAPMLMAPSILRESLHDPASREILDAVEISATRGAAIIQQLLTFSRGGGGTAAPVQLRHVVREMLAIIRETFPKNIVTRTDLHSEPWLVEADATQLHQVLMNLCVNSRDAMPEGGTLTIALENVDLDEAAVAGHPGAAAGPHVVLGVFDTGCGIAPEHLDKVFDPFFTTKAVGKGTGLGLATALGIVHAHRGFIQARSTLGAGTQVRVYLPAAITAKVPAATVAATPPPRGRGELVLVVDDEENVRRITRRILEHHGYRVLAASDGAEALARFQQHRESIQLVLTDLLMPIMDGATLIRAIHQIDASARVVAVSGHVESENPLHIGTDVVALLPKPYLRHTLLETVAKAIAR